VYISFTGFRYGQAKVSESIGVKLRAKIIAHKK